MIRTVYQPQTFLNLRSSAGMKTRCAFSILSGLQIWMVLLAAWLVYPHIKTRRSSGLRAAAVASPGGMPARARIRKQMKK